MIARRPVYLPQRADSAALTRRCGSPAPCIAREVATRLFKTKCGATTLDAALTDEALAAFLRTAIAAKTLESKKSA